MDLFSTLPSSDKHFANVSDNTTAAATLQYSERALFFADLQGFNKMYYFNTLGVFNYEAVKHFYIAIKRKRAYL